MAAPTQRPRIKSKRIRRLPSAPCSAFAKLEASYKEPKPVTLTPGEAAAIYRVILNMGVPPEYIADRAAGIGCDTSWQNTTSEPSGQQ